MSTNIVEIYTDGACRGNPGPGGWAASLRFRDNRKDLYGAESSTTNNRMELMAVIKGLEALNRVCPVRVYTDSRYVLDGITKWLPNWKKRGWKTASKAPVKNVELWQQLDAVASRIGEAADIDWQWVKGHAGIEGNEHVDALANKAIDELQDF